MPTYRVYEVQEEIFTRKWMYEVDAPDKNSAIVLAANGEADPIDCRTIGEPFYADSGFAAQPVDAPEDAAVWNEALSNLESINEG